MFNDGEWGVIILAHCNENFNDLQGAYLFAKIRKEQETYKANYPDADIISLGIGGVTQPLVPAVVEAMMKAVAETGEAETPIWDATEETAIGRSGRIFCLIEIS